MIAAGVLLAIGLAYASLSSSTVLSKRANEELQMPSVYFSAEHAPIVETSYTNANGQYGVIYSYYYLINYTNISVYGLNGTSYFTAEMYVGPGNEVDWWGSSGTNVFPLLQAKLEKVRWENSSLVAYVDVYARCIKDVYIGYNSSLYQVLSIREFIINNVTVIDLELQISKSVAPGSVLLIPVWTEGRYGESLTFIPIPVSRGY